MRLRAEEISFQYGRGKGRILDRISIWVGLTAPSGFGKTTLCRLLAGYERPDKGRVLLDDRPVETYKGRLPVQMIWQHPEQSVNPRWRMKHVLKEGGEISVELIRRLGITAMLDMVTQSLVWNVVLEEAKRRGIGVLAVSHSEGVLERVCTRRVIMQW